MTRSTPRSSDSGNIMPASMTRMSSPNRKAIMFMPNSPRPPSGMAVRDCAGLLKKEESPQCNRESYHSGEMFEILVGKARDSAEPERIAVLRICSGQQLYDTRFCRRLRRRPYGLDTRQLNRRIARLGAGAEEMGDGDDDHGA